MAQTAEQITPAQIAHVSPDTPLDEIFAIYERDKALIIDDLADPEALQTLWDQAKGPLHQDPMESNGFLGRKTLRLSGFISRLPACHPFALHPVVLGLMNRILGRVSGILLNSTQLMALQPGERRGPMHRDRWAWSALPLPERFEYVVNCMWALTDFTAENGATHFIPDSFSMPDPTRILDVLEDKAPTLQDGRVLGEIETQQATMKKGSAFVWSGSVYHGGGANVSDGDRVGMSITYVPSTMRQEENMSLIAPPEVARTYPEELQKLLGYDLGNWALGVVEDMQSPKTKLR